MSRPHSDTAPGSSTPKVAIKGFSLSSKATTKPKTAPSSSLGKRPRSTFAHDEDSDSEREERNGRQEAVTGFGAEGAIKYEERKRQKEGPLVIPRLENKGVGLGAKRGRNLLPPEVQAQRDAQRNGGKKEGKEVVNADDRIPSWGLTLTKREKVEEAKNECDEATRADKIDAKIGEQEAPKEEVKTVDQEALEALMGNGKKKGPDLVIAAVAENGERHQPITETDAYRRAIASAPDASTLEDYERIPVEEFGAALLRGMGWKGEKRGEVKDVKRRQNLLGLGAKELKDAEELGAWVQKSDVKRLNEKRGGHGGGERRPKVSEYKREKEKRDKRREERGGGSYRREMERERDGHRDSGRDRERYGERERERDRYDDRRI